MTTTQSAVARSTTQLRNTLVNTLPFLVLLLALSAATAKAQTTSGSVVGVVTDPSGAVVPNAKIAITNTATGQSRAMATGSGGTYSFNYLDPGTYSIDIVQSNFKHFTLNNIVVQVGGTARADATLQLGSDSQQVTVTATAPLIQTDSAAMSTVIEPQTIEDIPLNGRNVDNLLTLVPGVIAQGTTQGNFNVNIQALGNYQIGGGFGNQSIFFVDGVQSNIPESNANALIPDQDDTAEFRVSTNNATAEFGGYAGGVVNVTTKSGTNRFHASAYEYLRNKVLDANGFFNNRDGANGAPLARTPFVQNQYGLDVGGPVKQNKIFYFFNFEREPVRSSAVYVTSIPTPAMLNGDFSQLLLPASAGGPASGPVPLYDNAGIEGPPGSQFNYNGRPNTINPALEDPTFKALVALTYPTAGVGPNPNALVNNYISTQATDYEHKQYNGRVDWSLGSRDTVFVKYTHWDVASTPSNPFKLQSAQPGETGFIDDEAVVGDTFTLNPTTLFDVRLSYLRANFFTYPNGLGTNVSSLSPGLASMVQEQGQEVPPSLSFSGTPYYGGGVVAQLYWPNNIYTISGSVTKILGRHTLKIGGLVRQVAWIAGPDSNGVNLTFTSQYTQSPSLGGGYPFASGFLGTLNATNTDQVGGSRAFLHNYGFYITDTFQATPKLTVDLGARWDQPGSFSEVNNWNTVILPSVASPLGTISNPATGVNQALTGQLALVDSAAYPSRREENLHWDLLSPRVGLAYRFLPNTVVRGGYGINFLPSTLSQDGPNSSSVNSATTTLTNSYNANNTLSIANTSIETPFPNGIIQPPRRNAAAIASLYGQNIQSRVPNQAYSYVQQWNLTVERQLGNSSSISIAYAASRGIRLIMQGNSTWAGLNINQLPDQYLSMGSALEKSVPNPFYGTITSGGLLSAPTVYQGLLLLPHPQYGYMTAAASRNGESYYNSLQASFKKRFAHGGLITAAYTYSSFVSNTDSITQFLEPGDFNIATTQDNNNLNAERSRSVSDYPQTLVIGYGVDLPIGHGQHFLSNEPGPLNTLVSGWRVDGITEVIAGEPLSFQANPNDLQTIFGGGNYLSTSEGVGQERPNLVPGCQRKEPGSIISRVNSGTYFNTACFVQPGNLEFGNESRTDSVLRAQGVDNYDFSLTKTTHAWERLNVIFTAQFFNIFNRVQFAPPGTSLYDGSGFGAVTLQTNIPRQIQFGLRLAY